MDFSTMSGEALTAALALNVNTASDAALAAALVPRNEARAVLFAIDESAVTDEQAFAAEAITASVGEIEAEQTKRKAKAKKFAEAKAAFAAGQTDAEAEAAAAAEAAATAAAEAEAAQATADAEATATAAAEAAEAAQVEADEAAAAAEAAAAGDGDGAGEGDGAGDGAGEGEGGAVTAAQKAAAARAAARAAGKGNARPAVKAQQAVTIVNQADVAGFAVGQSLEGMEAVTKALLGRAKGFPQFSKAAALAVRSANGDMPDLKPVPVAAFSTGASAHLTADAVKKDGDYGISKIAVQEYKEALVASMYAASQGKDATLTAAGWCAPSENVYSFLADYVVDGLASFPTISAPRGGLNITTGPRVGGESQGQVNLDDFGWTQTEAQAIAKTVKPFETIVCPEFTDHRLDAIGYAYKIPLLTQKAYPEIVTDALRFASVLYAHKANRRKINDSVALSTDVAFSGYGASFTDSLEALCILAMRERRKWNLSENAVMEVKAPRIAREVYRADMSRRTGLALTDIATDQKISAEFAARNLSVEYVADWQEVAPTGPLVLQGSFKVMVYPAGTFAVAEEDVINMSGVYDAASLSVNEYTGIFLEQGYMLVKLGYGSSLLTIPINTAGETGAAIMQGLGDALAGGSF